MSQITEQVEEQVEEQEFNTQTTPTEGEATQKPVFEEIEGMNPGAAVNVLIQASQLAQSTGALSVRDAVMLAAAISVLRPGSI